MTDNFYHIDIEFEHSHGMAKDKKRNETSYLSENDGAQVF